MSINIGEVIKKIRNESGLSQLDLSKATSIDRAQISKIESGVIQGVTYNTIEKIFYALGNELVPVSIKQEKKLNIHPFVKWAGGKTQLLSTINEYLPKQINRYFEPFIGGGALLFNIQPKEAFVNDSNTDLMETFKCFKNNKLFKELKERLIEHENNHSEDYYLKIRGLDRETNYNDLPITEKAARLIYLNKACFNGLYRVNSNGFFNVPSGKKEKVNCFDRKNFEDLHAYFMNSNIHISNVDFEEVVKDAKQGDFVYFDPPYDTWEEKASFTSYSKDNFNKEDQARLAKVFAELSNKGVYVMLSNHNTKYIRELYKDFNIRVVNAKRMINSNGTGRGNVEEVIITNYE